MPGVLVKVYACYRFLLATVFLTLFLLRVAPDILGTTDPRLYLLVAAAYALATVLTLGYLIARQFQTAASALFAHLFLDMVALTLLMHSSGGFGSGIGFLILVTVATGSVMFTGQLAMLLAAMASICITLESVVSVMLNDTETRAIFPAGLLGILLFVTALIFQVLNRRLRDAEAIALREADQAAHLQQLNEMIVHRMLTGIIVVDVHNRIELINNAAIEHLGGHRPGASLASGQLLRIIPALWQQIEAWRIHPWLRSPSFNTKEGGSDIQANFAALDQGKEKRTIIFLEDIRAIAQHAQQMKLASLGKLTGSIAHEIRNPLGAISHAAQLLAELAVDHSELARLTEIIGKHALRVNQIVENVLQLSRQRAPAFQKIPLQLWLARFIQDYRDSCRQSPEIETTMADPSQQVMFDPSHLHQVITNLIDNSLRHGTMEGDNPWVAIETGTDERTGLPCLDVRDHGPGISEANLPHIFDPFFTTSHAGSGLGLYLARELCETNYATLDYLATPTSGGGFFRVGFAHPQRLLPR
ncbi:MAG: sensor histidine kinase [Porticoccaceae bacterium]